MDITILLMNIALICTLLIFIASSIKWCVELIINVVRNRDRKKEEEFFQRQYLENNFKELRDDVRDAQCKILNNLYRIETIEEKLNKKETKTNVKKKKRN